MSVPNNIHARLQQALFDSPKGGEWKRLVESSANVDIFIAGGCIRDLLLARGARPKDFDIFLGGPGVEKVLKRLASAGRLEHGPFGSPRWYPNPGSALYCDVIPITGFVNGLWRCENITDVLNQFDFTANAVAVDLRTAEFFDPQNGVRDIGRRVMRAVRFDYPEERIAPEIGLSRPEVLWFRILHYAAVLKLTIEPVTLEWLRANRRYEPDAARFESVFFPLHRRWLASLEPRTP